MEINILLKCQNSKLTFTYARVCKTIPVKFDEKNPISQKKNYRFSMMP